MAEATAPTPTTLYRLYDKAGKLLYVGIGGNPGRRWEQHRGHKPWWGDVASTTLEHFPTRQAAMAAELTAIRTEDPVHNIAGRLPEGAALAKATNRRSYGRSTEDSGPPRFFCRDRWGQDRSSNSLALVWEVDYAAVSDDFYHDDDPHDIFDVWWDKIVDRYKKWVPIYWFIDGISFEAAPFSEHILMEQDFLSFFSWPVDLDGNLVNWLTLPLDHAKSWWVPKCTGWTPSPYEPYVDKHVLRVAAMANRGIPTWRAPLPGDKTP